MQESATATPTLQAAPIVTLSGVGKTFDNGTVALAGTDLVVRRGEFLSLLGPSGCGKSTILRLVAGLDEPTVGTIEWHDNAKGRAAQRERNVGYVFQEPTLMPWATVFDNAWLPLRLKGISRRKAEGQIMTALESVGLADFRAAYPRELSGGMKMRVSIARALATSPSILLMDEPFAALDEITRFRLNDDLLRLWDEKGWTVIFVTHSVFESVYLSTRIAVMTARPGRIATEVIVDEPSPRTEAFRTSPKNGEIARRTSEALHRAMGE
ncbi:ABC transporter ATP-binding protein [Acuticoccus kandeliae]|uniref:ABC transporter ATP-binding protein n=1 Tax=Acuticoccus kandeliae TaxID=2073160 RepID=UPI000D3E7CFC|nr:ABC transporter ATP-binding protein [Acuticoccus kandeliae]